jgi:hypothetical protein
MGREIKRVPLNFDWPLGRVWRGFLNPHYDGHCKDCDECNGRGSTTAMQRVEDLASLLLMSAEDAIRGRVHPYFEEAPLYNTRGIVVSKNIIELAAGLAGRSAVGRMGHDCTDRHEATKAIIRAAGFDFEEWGWCKACEGEGSVWDGEENKRKAENWEREEPPAGDGYQLWETVTEGSPISPVFDTPEKLADWLVSPAYDCTSDSATTREQWLKFITGPGWAPSMVSIGGKLMTGVEAVSEL